MEPNSENDLCNYFAAVQSLSYAARTLTFCIERELMMSEMHVIKTWHYKKLELNKGIVPTKASFVLTDEEVHTLFLWTDYMQNLFRIHIHIRFQGFWLGPSSHAVATSIRVTVQGAIYYLTTKVDFYSFLQFLLVFMKTNCFCCQKTKQSTKSSIIAGI